MSGAVRGLAAVAVLQRGGALQRFNGLQYVRMTLTHFRWCSADETVPLDERALLRECLKHDWRVVA